MLIGDPAVGEGETAQPAVAVVRVEVLSPYLGNPLATVDRSADDRAGRILMSRIRQRRLLQSGLIACPRPAAAGTFHDVPAVIDTGRRHRNDVDLLELVSSDVRDIQQPGRAIERESPRIS